MTKILVLYYSSYGHIEKMAYAAAEGVKSAKAEAVVKRVPELVPEDAARKSGYKLDQPAPIAVGPALLAMETGAPIYASAARRVAGGRYRCRVFLVPAPETGTRRERLIAHTAAIAAAFESIVADAPEQWWGAFHPIWPDLAAPDGPAASSS